MYTDIEQAVLGCMVQYEDSRFKIIDRLTAEDFERAESKMLFSLVLSMHKARKPIDLALTIAEAPDPSIAVYCVDCAGHSLSSRYLESYIDKIKEISTKKELSRLSRMFSEAVDSTDTAESIISMLSEQFTKIVNNRIGIEEYDHYKSVTKFYEHIEEGLKSSKSITGLRTPWPTINFYTKGLHKGKTYIIGGLKKTGKTRFLMNMISGFLEDEEPGMMFSMEMNENDLHGCVVACRTGIDTSLMGTKDIPQREFGQLLEQIPKYCQDKFMVSRKSGITPEYVRSAIRSAKQRQPIQWVAIDYIQRMTAKGIQGRTEVVEYCATQIADIARDENVAMIVLSQLSGGAESNRGDAPIYSFMKNSQAILEAADGVIVLDDPNRGKEVDTKDGIKDINAILLLRGGVSDKWVNFKADLKCSKFIEEIRKESL